MHKQHGQLSVTPAAFCHDVRWLGMLEDATEQVVWYVCTRKGHSYVTLASSADMACVSWACTGSRSAHFSLHATIAGII